ncbi:MAG TPA: hypothetical protein VJS20_01325 [Gemmatimonadales bacterium]|nr:hypothetical protein [Gemmatimonadales bacterium]
MKIAALLALVLAVSLPGAAQEGDKKERKAHPGFERLKKLVGSWQADTKQMGKVDVTYRLVSGGSTLMETIMPGQPHEMVSMYHLDGDELVMTHYCAIGNQPRMKAEKESKEGTLDFRCVGGSNMKCDTDAHMHSALLTFVDADHLTAEWTMMKGGKTDHAMKFEYVRQKK